MSIADIKRQMRQIAEQMIDTADGASWAPVVDAWRSTNRDHLTEISAEMMDSWLRNAARDIIRELTSAGNGQVPLPGFGDIDTYVTTRTAEGDYKVKHIRWATEADLLVDADIHDDNVRQALAARRRAQGRNRTLMPVMREQGFEHAGQALDWLETHG